MNGNEGISAIGTRPVGRRKLMAGGFAATVGSLALTQAQEAAASQGPVVPGAQPGGVGLAVTGVGEASAPAEAAVVQFIARFGGGFFPGKESAAVPATPVAVPDEALTALVDALAGAGVPADAIETTTFADGPFGGPFGPGTALILAPIDGELLDQIPAIVDAVMQAGAEQGIGFDQVGVGFSVTDCAAVEQQALVDAVANGRAQADGLAQALGVTLGALVQAGRQPAYGYYGPISSSCDAIPTLESARETYLPPFNPIQEPEVELYVQVNLTYAFA